MLRNGLEIPTEAWTYSYSYELFFYLYFKRPQAASQDEILQDLWLEQDGDPTDSRVYSAVSKARHVVDCPFALARLRHYRWNPEVRCSSDVDDFVNLLDRARKASTPAGSIDALEWALAHYRQDLLPSFDRSWCVPLREQLAARRRRALLDLGNFYLERQDPRARERFEQAWQADEYSEEALRGLMRFYALVGEHGAALRLGREFADRLQAAFGSTLSEQSQALYRSICEGRLGR